MPNNFMIDLSILESVDFVGAVGVRVFFVREQLPVSYHLSRIQQPVPTSTWHGVADLQTSFR